MSHTIASRYSTSSKVPITSHSSIGEYVLTVRDLPADEKPREKLVKEGPLALSVAELFAVILNTGTKREGVLSMASRIVKEYGEKAILSERNAKRLALDLDIPIIRAVQVIATIELGRRFFERSDSGFQSIRTPKDVFEHTKGMHNLPKEHLRGIYLNSHYKVIHDEVISIGTIDASIIHPREVFRLAVEHSASAVILVHNHPSGVLKPSDADVAITKQLVEAGKLVGIELIDHVIVTKDNFVSIFPIV